MKLYIKIALLMLGVVLALTVYFSMSNNGSSLENQVGEELTLPTTSDADKSLVLSQPPNDEIVQLKSSHEIIHDDLNTGLDRQAYLPEHLNMMTGDVGSEYQRYSENIDKAMSGDPRSQFEVAQALTSCAGSPPSQYAMTDDPDLNPKTIQIMDGHFSYCVDLLEEVGLSSSEMHNEAEEWRRKSVAGNYPLALSLEVVLNSSAFSRPDARARMIDALKLDTPKALMHVAHYYAVFEEEDEVTREAWYYLACKSHSACNPDELKRTMEKYSSDVYVAELLMKVEILQSSIDSQAWNVVIPVR